MLWLDEENEAPGVSRSLRGVPPPAAAEAVDPTEGDGDGGARARLVPPSLDAAADMPPRKAACCRSRLDMIAVVTRFCFGSCVLSELSAARDTKKAVLPKAGDLAAGQSARAGSEIDRRVQSWSLAILRRIKFA